jgi:hypothetical protein
MNPKTILYRNIVIALLSLGLMSCAHGGVTITPGDKGLKISGVSDTLTFTMAYPALTSLDQKKIYKNIGAEVKDSNIVVIKYDGGGEITLTVQPTGVIAMAGGNMPSDIGFVQMRMTIGLSFNNGGTWQFGSDDAKPFPLTQPAKPHLYQGNAASVTIRSANGQGIKLTVPDHSYQELADSRAWGWQAYNWMSLAPYAPGTELDYKFDVADPAPTSSASTASP